MDRCIAALERQLKEVQAKRAVELAPEVVRLVKAKKALERENADLREAIQNIHAAYQNDRDPNRADTIGRLVRAALTEGK